MAHYIDKDALVAEIRRWLEETDKVFPNDHNLGRYDMCKQMLSFINNLEVKEVQENKLPNPRFPHLDNIVGKVFGAGNLESFEYDEAEQLVLLAKEELLKDLEVKDVDLEKSISDWLFEGLPNDKELIDYIKETAKHFFELGLSVSNSTKVTIPDIDDDLKEYGVNPYSKEAKIIKESYFMAIEKLAQKGE